MYRVMLKKRLKPIYLIFLTIPLVYFLLWNSNNEVSSSDSKSLDYFYFSAMTSKPATLILIAGKDSLLKRNVRSEGYKNLEYVGPINDSAGYKIIINDININDTISLSGFNLFRNNHLFSLYDNFEKKCTAVNAVLTEKNGTLIAVVQQSGIPVCINIKPSSDWETKATFNLYNSLIILIFVIAFFILLVFAPPPKYFVVSVMISLGVMIICYMTNIDFKESVSMSSNSSINGVEIFYNQNPFFNVNKQFSSDDITNEYIVPINLQTEKFLRCDVGKNTTDLKNFQITIKSGIFSSCNNLASIPQGKLILNDIILIGNTYYVTGDDPYFALTSTYFIERIIWLKYLMRNFFLLITISIFLILISIHSFVGGLNRIKFKWAYFAFLLIPITYCIITQPWKTEIPSQYPDHFYFSARTSKPADISLFNGNDSITSWVLNSPAYKYFQYDGKLKPGNNFHLRINNLSANDTISLLSVNLYHDNHVYSLFNKSESVCTISNARFLENPNEVNATVIKANAPVIVKLLPFNILKKGQPEHWMRLIAILAIFVSFIIVIIVAPNQRYLIFSCIIASFLMLLFFWLGSDIQEQTTLKSSSTIDNAELFYNCQPGFLPSQKKPAYKDSCFFRAQVEIVDYNFLRWDISINTKEIKDLSISIKMGILRNNWDYSTIPPEHLMMNDLIRRNGTYYVCGEDPYFVLSTACQIRSIRWLILLRQNIFFFLTTIFFLALLFARKQIEKFNPSAFILASAFLVLISSGLILHFFNSERIILLREKRLAWQLPAYRFDTTEVFIKKLDGYFNDQIPGRNNMITTNNLIEFSIFKQLVNNPNVHFGEDGWMFYIKGQSKEMLENRQQLTPQELKKMTDVMVARRDWLKERDIHFYIMFPPNAYVIYEEKVGPRLRRYNKRTKLDELLEYIKAHSDLDIIDVYTPLKEAKKKYPYDLYYKTDPHWNFVGSYFAYNAMINHIKKDFPDVGEPLAFNNIYWFEFEINGGGLLEQTAIENYYTRHEYFPIIKNPLSQIDTIYPKYPGLLVIQDPIGFINKPSHRPSMLMFRDSFALWLMPYLTNNFNRSVYIWSPLFHPDIVEIEKPDIVIQEMADHVIFDLLAPNPTLTPMKDTTHSNHE